MPDDDLAEIAAAVHRGGFRSCADALRTDTAEFLTRRREARIDALLEAEHRRHPPGEEEAAWAEISLEGFRTADLDW